MNGKRRLDPALDRTFPGSELRTATDWLAAKFIPLAHLYIGTAPASTCWSLAPRGGSANGSLPAAV
jgi:hypothetical protein